MRTKRRSAAALTTSGRSAGEYLTALTSRWSRTLLTALASAKAGASVGGTWTTIGAGVDGRTAATRSATSAGRSTAPRSSVPDGWAAIQSATAAGGCGVLHR